MFATIMLEVTKYDKLLRLTYYAIDCLTGPTGQSSNWAIKCKTKEKVKIYISFVVPSIDQIK